MLCQSVKREQWMDQLRNKLLDVPYLHITFTLPHELNSLCRMNASRMYSLLMKSSWQTIKEIGIEQGYTPGMTSVLHTFGSDLKYHIHVHALVSYGGVDQNGEWVYPKFKNRIENYRKLNNAFRNIFLEKMIAENQGEKFEYHLDFNSTVNELKKQLWVVHSTRPTMDTQVIENYLARYINRVAISSSRLKYNTQSHLVNIEFNDYKNQQQNQAAPKSIKSLMPLDAIYQILQHSLPAYFQKSRNYGLHHPSNKIKQHLPIALKRKGITIRTIFEIITHLLKLKPLICEVCGGSDFIKMPLPQSFLQNDTTKYIYQLSPPTTNQKYYPNTVLKPSYNYTMTNILMPPDNNFNYTGLENQTNYAIVYKNS